ncbi:major facilitator family transporter protein [Fusarium bulbicola]|nr:major facilitator family transporter protein [Fusarium bulbicola]
MSTESDAEKQQPGIPVPWERDPENPQNWNTGRKALNLGIDSTLGFITKFHISPLESSVIVPGVPLLKDELYETRPPVTSLVVSIFVLGFAFGPLLLSPLSELYGRRLLLNTCNVVTLGFSIGSALAPNIATFIVFRRLDVFRFIAGKFGADPMNIGGASIVDQAELPTRGFVMSIFFTGDFLSPVIGPVIGGFVAKDLDWRWVFWTMAIFRKRAKDTDMAPNKEALKFSQVLLRALRIPIRMLIRSPIIAGLPISHIEQYGLGIDILGLAFLGLSTQINMIDAFTTYAASALAATSVIRSIVGGYLPIAGLPLYSALGYRWGNSLLGFIAIVVSIAPLLFWRYGETLRKRYDV